MANSVIEKSLASEVNGIKSDLNTLDNSTVKITGDRISGIIYNGQKISNLCRSNTVPKGLSFWNTQNADDSPFKSTVSLTIINKPTDTGQYSVCLMFLQGHVCMSSQLGASGDFTWVTLGK